jgi:hypothetical protein
MNKRRRNPLKDPAAAAAAKVGWRVSEWSEAVGLCRATVYKLMTAKTVECVKSGSARIIITPPADYLASLAAEAVEG